MADVATTISEFLTSIAQDPVKILLVVGGIALLLVVVIAHRIHKIHSEDIFVHQAWGANWKGPNR